MEFVNILPDGYGTVMHYTCKNKTDFSNMIMFIISNTVGLPNISIYGAGDSEKIVKQHYDLYLRMEDKNGYWDTVNFKNIEIKKLLI